jgi:hypothetical protein
VSAAEFLVPATDFLSISDETEKKMPRGGKRPGAGRPKGSKNKFSLEQSEQREHYANVNAPLDYLLAVMRDPLADLKRRDKAAKAAAPYCHAKQAAAGKTAAN